MKKVLIRVLIGCLILIGCVLCALHLIGLGIRKESLDNAKLEAAKSGALEVINGAKLYYTESLLDSTKIVKPTGNSVTTLTVSGTQPTSGTWDWDSSTGTITLRDVVVDDYTCNGTSKNLVCEKN